MIVRMLLGRAAAGGPDGGPAHFNNAVAPELHNAPGFVNAALPDGGAISWCSDMAHPGGISLDQPG